MNKNIAIIGGGNLGQSIASGLLSQHYNPSQITITRHKINLLQSFSDQGVQVISNNVKAVSDSQIIILAVKPYKIEAILNEIDAEMTKDKIIISVVSSYSINQIESHLTTTPIIIRAMPNTATSVNASVTCIASKNASKDHINQVHSIFDSLGETILIDEHLMDAATVLGACGIAYVLRFMRAMIQGGIEIGFDAQTASKIAIQTVKGASKLIQTNGNHPEAEIDKVTTPRGCTIAGLNEMEHQGFSSALIKGIKTSYENILN